jgi:phosphoribosylformylglycinamidine synthase
MGKPRVAVISFPGNNCEVESLRAIQRNGMEAMPFRWNDDRSRLEDCDGYFVPGGFAYEDRGRSGMVAARDDLMLFLRKKAEEGRTIIGNCNGAQILVESGLIPLGEGLLMSLARNVQEVDGQSVAAGFLNEWVWIKPTCARGRAATSDWEEPMHLPIAHGEGRFTTKDRDLVDELRRNDQIAFSYCTADGHVSDHPVVTPNGSMFAIAGICNPAGNVVALMPHPERTHGGDPYFQSLRRWLEKDRRPWKGGMTRSANELAVPAREPRPLEIFIDTIIVNNEERTLEQTARKYVPALRLKQWRYLAPGTRKPDEILRDLSQFNPNKERAFIRMKGALHRWDAQQKKAEALGTEHSREIFSGIHLLRRDQPDTGSGSLGEGGETGICYSCRDVPENALFDRQVLEVFVNPHASTLERISSV